MGVYKKVKTWPLQGMVEKVLIVDRGENTSRGIWKRPEQGEKVN